jgi:uncharacterized protein YlaI
MPNIKRPRCAYCGADVSLRNPNATIISKQKRSKNTIYMCKGCYDKEQKELKKEAHGHD